MSKIYEGHSETVFHNGQNLVNLVREHALSISTINPKSLRLQGIKVINIGSDTFCNLIFHEGLQN